MKNAVFLDVTPCGSCKNRRFGGRVTRIDELGTLAVASYCRKYEEIPFLLESHGVISHKTVFFNVSSSLHATWEVSCATTCRPTSVH
jgi:hypothetical protein